MKNVFYTLALLLFTLSAATGQGTFEKRIKSISDHIEKINKEEREVLKNEVDAINDKLDAGTINRDEASTLKLQAAEQSAARIATKVAPFEEEIQDLVKQKAEGKFSNETTVIESDDQRIKIEFSPRWKEKKRGQPRTTSQFVFAFGRNNLVTDGDFNSISDSDFRFGNSRFYEWGLTYKTRIFANNNFLHFKYGLSLIYNNLRPTDNRYFVENGNQTELAQFPEQLTKEVYFRNIQLVLPLHLEFDFGKKKVNDDKVVFKTQKTVRAGLGGYAGFNLRTRQILHYRQGNNDVYQKIKGDYNTNSFIYGLGAYIGYKDISFYTKYDLNNLFRNNPVDQNNISFGLRFDFN
ncbi:MAG: hypothetical protein IPM42_12395 [Saprospiraceae bacterium]|nr:hypothetical protein [Saprospiraceae bacterium]